ncbi:hypothetical protein BDV39DRAFT_2077 [Aspergillus sergii]|uniref:Uncharacterized protein n=1 Tax=Aspergillus sergii TaxID=1034303 RepID=A0A5N6XLQ3_9EURO|nr:hypothetical protein BDV39DRAFT_2077 [Aspergillus sergii]
MLLFFGFQSKGLPFTRCLLNPLSSKMCCCTFLRIPVCRRSPLCLKRLQLYRFYSLPSFSTFVSAFTTLAGPVDAMKVGNLTLMLTKSVQCHDGTSFTVSHGGCVTYTRCPEPITGTKDGLPCVSSPENGTRRFSNAGRNMLIMEDGLSMPGC